MRLVINVYGSEPYDLDFYDLADCIEQEADNVLGEANADHLEDNTDECRDALRAKVIRDATARLRRPGDSYTDPIGVTWRLEATES